MSRRVFRVLLVGLALLAGWCFWPQSRDASTGGRERDHPAAASRVSGSKPGELSTGSRNYAAMAEEFPLAAPLNAADSNIHGDLDTLRVIFEAWRTNFPREGNPVGENADITAALTGDNRLSLVLIPKTHPAINARSELCDRWGTPFRFHQISGERMELRSAGPDKKFGTADDAFWPADAP